MRLKYLLMSVLLILVGVPLVAHYYMSRIEEGAQDDTHRTRIKLEALEDVSSLKASDLRMRIEELLRIKSSVGNELRELESRRQALQVCHAT